MMLSFVIGIYVGKSVEKRGIPFIGKQSEWSIGIYTGESPFNFIPYIKNPVLSAKNVTDIIARDLADPFMIKNKNIWYMFFEVINKKTIHGDIGLALSNDGLHWTYNKIVLDEPFHLSYPYVFKVGKEYYMIPETHEMNSVRLYKAVDFPTQWAFIKTLVEGNKFVDPSIFNFNNMWWLFVSLPSNDVLHLYYAEKLTGPWIKHPMNPIISNNCNTARPGGRVLVFDNRIIRYTQDDCPTYGNQVRAFEITELTTKSYKEKEVKENPILKAGVSGWNQNGMHHIDPHQIDEKKWIACVDGYKTNVAFGFKF